MNADGCALPDPTRRGDWMQTRHGRKFWPLDPNPDEVFIDDIASHLSKITRYCGACLVPYSVAEHSVAVSYLVPGHLAFAALLHDAAEAYCQDIPRPLKRHLREYGPIEAAVEAAIYSRFGVEGLTADDWQAIKDADNAALLAEQVEIMAPAPDKWAPIDVPVGMLDTAHRLLRHRAAMDVPWYQAEALFLDRFEALDLACRSA